VEAIKVLVATGSLVTMMRVGRGTLRASQRVEQGEAVGRAERMNSPPPLSSLSAWATDSAIVGELFAGLRARGHIPIKPRVASRSG